MATSAQRSHFVGRAEPLAGQAVELFYQEYGRGAEQPELYVLALTGNAGRAESMQRITEALFATWLGSAGAPTKIGVLSLQYPGYGVAPEGSATLESLTASAAEAVAVLRERAGTRPIFLHALSMGTVAALYATRVSGPADVQGLVLAKPPNLGSLLVGEYGWWNLWLIAGPMALLLPDSAESADNAAAIERVPALFLIAEEDRVVPERYSTEVFEAYGGPKRRLTVPGAHNTTVWSRTSPDLDASLGWLWSAALEAEPRPSASGD